MKKKPEEGKRVKNIHDIVDYAIRSKRFVGGLGRLKKNGKVVKINGQIFDRKTSKNGDSFILIDNFLGNPREGTNKRWQVVLLRNLICLNECGWMHSKRSA